MRQDEGSAAETPAEAGVDRTGEIDLSPSAAIERLDGWIDGLVSLLPNIVVALVVLAIFWFLGNVAKRQLQSRLVAHERSSLGMALGRIAKIVFTVLGFAFALTIVAPSIDLGTLVGSLGIGSVAIGFAFKDILQNWLAGMLILIRKPFVIGDQIEAAGFEGTVEEIETRATVLRTFNGEHVLIPNSTLYTNPVTVRTRTKLSRGEYVIGVGYDADIDEVLSLIEGELKAINGVASEPAPDAFAWELAESSVNIKARWWTKAERAEQVRIRGEAVRAIKIALDKAGVEIPFPQVVMNTPGGGGDVPAELRERAAKASKTSAKTLAKSGASDETA